MSTCVCHVCMSSVCVCVCVDVGCWMRDLRSSPGSHLIDEEVDERFRLWKRRHGCFLDFFFFFFCMCVYVYLPSVSCRAERMGCCRCSCLSLLLQLLDELLGSEKERERETETSSPRLARRLVGCWRESGVCLCVVVCLFVCLGTVRERALSMVSWRRLMACVSPCNGARPGSGSSS